MPARKYFTDLEKPIRKSDAKKPDKFDQIYQK